MTRLFSHGTLLANRLSSNVTHKKKKDRKYTYNITLWRVSVTIVAMEMQQCVMCIVELHVTVNNITILSVARNCFYGEFISPATNETYPRPHVKW